MTRHTISPVRRAYTAIDMTAVLGRVDATDSTGVLLAAVITAVYDTILADSGLTLTSLPTAAPIDHIAPTPHPIHTPQEDRPHG